MRKELCAHGFIQQIRNKFLKIPDPRIFSRPNNISFADCLLSCFAVFSLKWPSLLQYEEESKNPIVLKNFRDLYFITTPPSDTYMRMRLDELDPFHLRPAYKKVFSMAQRGKVLEKYQFLEGYYLFSVDGTGYFSSHKVHCDNCCVKNYFDKKKSYYHNMVCGAIVHPEKKEVIPFCPEPIQLQDGATKNDCEQHASKRLFQQLRKEHPHLKLIVIQDGLAETGPNVQLLESLKMKYIIVSNSPVFDWIDPTKISYFDYVDEDENLHKYRFVNQIPLNGSYPDVKTNFFDHTVYMKGGKKQYCSWKTNIYITKDNIHQLKTGGRARWKIENETFNTLKNQGYHFEHNFGHGNKNLCTVMCFLMVLAFLIDQLQLISCNAYQEAKFATRTFYSLWEKMRTFFAYIELRTWEKFFALIAKKIVLDTT